MLGLAALSQAPISALPGAGVAPGTAVFGASGTSAFSGVGASIARAAWSVSGVGALQSTGVSFSIASWNSAGSGVFAGIGVSSATSQFSFAGVGEFHALGRLFQPTPASRTATVPFLSRSLLISREAREQAAPVSDRELTVTKAARTIQAPRYPRIDMPLNWPSKDPDELLDYSINWSQALAGDTIITSEWAISGESLVENHSTNNSTASVIWLEDGTLNQTYTVTNTIETAAGRRFQQSANIRILSN